MLTGDVLFAIGYSEPESGTDLASLQTKAEFVDGQWIINGAKVFTSGASQADYVWLAARTDPTASKHRGITIFIVPTSDPGFSCTPIETSGITHTNASYYRDIRVGPEAVVGEVNAGWQLITAQLGHERVGLAAMGGRTEQLWTDVAKWAQGDPRRRRTGDRPPVGSHGTRPQLREGHRHASAELEAGCAQGG